MVGEADQRRRGAHVVDALRCGVGQQTARGDDQIVGQRRNRRRKVS
jgi:hypothetical protein